MLQTTNKDIIAREGFPFIALGFGLVLVGWLIHPILFVLFLALTLFVVSFFRNPKRACPEEHGILVVPADGKVLSIDTVQEDRFLKDRVKRVCIFMSPANVHVNRAPVSGLVEKVSYNKGKFFPAYAQKASLDNEQNAVVVRNEGGERILFIQIAGWLARRIVCYAKEGDVLKGGAIYGLIRFGSRMDVYFPMHYEVKVSIGQNVKAGETVLASK
ncbi:MAG: phosphatidylserine decarboxylase [Deltaproteobacteria bacterium GWA2_45_12]|nr:MAG: phosphatidylserine decarboxylase [Deltaproteobacteria bacterium GWA2_45_12]